MVLFAHPQHTPTPFTHTRTHHQCLTAGSSLHHQCRRASKLTSAAYRLWRVYPRKHYSSDELVSQHINLTLRTKLISILVSLHHTFLQDQQASQASVRTTWGLGLL